ncbi:hypothetical protein [Breznakia pachnodae]|uniref:K+-sensing histidine kinase KdpD n=1 Tax=Breznakia pachnodae TaxID=265178 RepID=A0ABU0E5D0_9FIRM|nr:hypothetical protein [Breznakia pachnodae]MDQ0362113.1 K+-sensing histidine kinase KdpD [Breznakia pachnodae]
MPRPYDEREGLIRWKSLAYAFVLVIALLLIISIFPEDLFSSMHSQFMFILGVSLTFIVIYQFVNDAYYIIVGSFNSTYFFVMLFFLINGLNLFREAIIYFTSSNSSFLFSDRISYFPLAIAFLIETVFGIIEWRKYKNRDNT